MSISDTFRRGIGIEHSPLLQQTIKLAKRAINALPPVVAGKLLNQIITGKIQSTIKLSQLKLNADTPMTSEHLHPREAGTRNAEEIRRQGERMSSVEIQRFAAFCRQNNLPVPPNVSNFTRGDATSFLERTLRQDAEGRLFQSMTSDRLQRRI